MRCGATLEKKRPFLASVGWLKLREAGRSLRWRYEVYVRSFPGLGSQRKISTNGGTAPLWRRRDGRERFYRTADGNLMAVTVDATGDSFTRLGEDELVQFRPCGALVTPYYSVTSDGQRFLVCSTVETDAVTPLKMLVNWSALLDTPR